MSKSSDASKTVLPHLTTRFVRQVVGAMLSLFLPTAVGRGLLRALSMGATASGTVCIFFLQKLLWQLLTFIFLRVKGRSVVIVPS